MLGPSGSGKTTTLRMIAGFEIPDEGTIELAGRGRLAPPAVRPAGEHRVPGLRALPAHDRAGERRVRAHGEEGEEGRAPRSRGERARDGAAVRLRRPQAVPALRWSAAAGRARACDREPAEGAPARRAARCARPEAAPGDADRAEVDPARGRHHVRVRDARPGGGADDVRPSRRLQQREDRADRAAGRGVRASAERVHRGLRRRVQRARARRAPLHRSPGEDQSARGRAGAGARSARRGGSRAGRAVRRACHPLPRYARPRWRAPGAWRRTSKKARARCSR